MKNRNSGIKNIFLGLLVLFICINASAGLLINAAQTDSVLEKAQNYVLSKVSAPKVGSVGGEWAVIALARSGKKLTNEYKDSYYKNVEEYVKSNINDKEQMNRSKSTDNSRIILSLTSIGKDPSKVAGHNLLKGLADFDYVKKQGISGPVWALLAFDCDAYEIPQIKSGEQTARDRLIDYITDSQLSDGGWTMSGNKSDPDMTGMAVQALAPYYESDKKAAAAIDKAVKLLSQMQLENGAYRSWGSISSESCAQVVVALCSLGIDPSKDTRFVKKNGSVMDAMLSFGLSNGGFLHSVTGTDSDKSANQMATEQVLYALAAYSRFTAGRNSLYDMTAEKSRGSENDEKQVEVNAYIIHQKGETITSKNLNYIVTAPGGVYASGKVKKGKAALVSANGLVTRVVIPSSIKVDGITYNVTSVAAGAFKNDSRITYLSIGTNVTKIGKKAFSNCKNLKTVKNYSKVILNEDFGK